MSITTDFELGQIGAQIKRLADVATGGQKDIFVRLPGLEGYYPMGIVDQNAKAINHAIWQQDLLQTGVCPIGYDGNSYREVGNGINYLSTSIGFGMTGLETFISSTLRGFTIGGWVSIQTQPLGLVRGLMGKDGIATNRGYAIYLDTGNTPTFTVSVDGTATLAVASAKKVVTGSWSFVAARFKPSTELAIFVDGVKTVNTTSVPASQFISSQNFEVGRFLANNGRILHTRTRDVFVCRAALDDDTIEQIRTSSAP